MFPHNQDAISTLAQQTELICSNMNQFMTA